MSINDTKNKRGRGRPPKDAIQIGLRLESDLVSDIDDYLEDKGIKRPEAIRQLIRFGIDSLKDK